jgi:hypothetical protein
MPRSRIGYQDTCFAQQGAHRYPGRQLPRFARKAGAARVATEAPELDELRASRRALPRLLHCSDKAAVWLSSTRTVEFRPMQAPAPKLRGRSQIAQSSSHAGSRKEDTRTGCGSLPTTPRRDEPFG